MSNVETQISEMARLTVLSNKINPVQEKNMSMWPLVFFNGVKSVKIEYDLSKTKNMDDGPETNNSIISYRITIDESDNHHLDNRFKAIEKAARDLFWKEVAVEIYFNNKIVFKSEKL